MEVHLLTDSISLTILAHVFRGATVLLLIVVFVPGAIIAWLFRPPRG